MANIIETIDAPSNPSTSFSIDLGDVFEGVIDRSGDIDWVRVSLEADYGYYFTVAGDTSATPLGSKDLRIWTAGGDQVDRFVGGGTARVEVNTTSAGDFFIDVRGSSSTQVGGYQLIMHREIVNTAGTRETLAIGSSMVSAIDYSGDQDWVRVELEEGYGYFFRVEGDGSSTPAVSRDLRLLTSAGGQLDRVVGGGDTFVHADITAAGTYYLDMRGSSSSVTGGYRLSAQREVAGTAVTRETLTMDQTLEGRIDYVGDRDWHRVTLEANQTIRISTIGIGTTPLGSHTIVLRDASGRLVDQEGSISGTNELVFTIPADGVYYIDLGGSVPGDFRVTLADGIRVGTNSNDVMQGSSRGDRMQGGFGNDNLSGNDGNDTLEGGDGGDTLNGGNGDDFLFGGTSNSDIRDVIFGGEGNDSIDGGAGNDDLNGGNGNDTVVGGLGSDTVIGNDGNDVLVGSGGSDAIFGNAGNDFINGGFGYDRLNGGTGADAFFHQGVPDHGSDWIQDYNAAEGDVLAVGIAGARASDFQINFASTAGAGDAGVREAFVIHRPTGQILFALVDGEAQSSINISLGGQVFDLLS